MIRTMRVIWDSIRYKPAPAGDEYWKPPTLTEDQKKTACMLSVDDEGNAYGFNPVFQPDPAWVKNTKSRLGFVFNPYYHPMGIFFQGTIKGAMLKCIDFCHSGILKYDARAYEYSDPRLKTIQECATAEIHRLFTDPAELRTRGDGTRKVRFMLKLMDIGLFLMKEDIFYRYRFIAMIQALGKACEHMDPTSDEGRNLKGE